jgi:two-component system, LytTR family, sensor histidine kinase AlgZ
MDPRTPHEWLPDFCRVPTVFAIVVAAEIAVLVISFAPVPEHEFVRRNLLVSSLFAQWLALVTAVLLCKLRETIHRLPIALGALAAWGLPVSVALIGSWMVHRLDDELGTGLTAAIESRASFVLGSTAIVALLAAALLRYFYMQEQWKAQVRAHAQAEVKALQARIKPHFLFNSMNTIASLVRRDPVTAERAIEDLADLFRAALGAGQGESTLGEELVLAERFLAIEKLRLGERLQVRFDLPDDLPRELAMPRLILQPLVENAVIHGIARLADGGTIELVAAREGFNLRLHLRNPAPPPDEEPGTGNRHAQGSIAQRLAHHFGARARMTAEWRDGYYAVMLWLPLG